MAAYKVAISVGVSPVEFWDMTPYLTRTAIQSMSDERITQTWMLAGMMRAKKLPELSKLLSKKTDKKDISQGLKMALMSLNTKSKKE